MHKYLLFALMLSGCAAYSATSGQIVLKDDSQTANFRFSDSDRAMIEGYYKNSASRQKAKSSAPAKLVKGNFLPSRIQGEPLPRELEQKLSPLPHPYARVRVGQDVVLMDKKTRVMVDVVYGVAD
ncbi:hypothetical protein [Sulfuricaulis sp.]|jgi:hypothetical protein|uniref:hypothetical protein n=1 Tax=Sulfuricaulis sp. TaxID=2003553 RepID=UPI003559699A